MKNQQARRRAHNGLVLSRALTPVVPALLLAAASSVYGQQTITYTDGQNNVNPIAITADLNPTTLFIDSGSATQSGVISQSEAGILGKVNKDGNGTLVLAADNTYAGGTVVDRGTLQLSAGSLIAGFINIVDRDGGIVFSPPAVTVNSTATFVAGASTTVVGLSLPPVVIANAEDGGIGVQVNAGGTLVNHGSINGGNSQLVLTFGDAGTGGAGVVLANGAASLLNSSLITGGDGLGGGTGGTGIWVQTTGTFSNNGTVSGGNGSGSIVVPTTGTGGSGLLLDSSATFNNAGTINGGDAGNAMLTANGGNGGNGGIGVKITAGGTLSNSGSIVGKAGGTGALYNGGNGGQGVLLTSGGAFTNERSGSVVGGGAGAAGFFGHDGTSAPAVELTAGGTVINSGTISGKTGVQFSGAAGTLTNSGTITGSVSMGNFANHVTLVTGGKIAGDLDMSSNPSTTLTLGGAGTQTYSAAVTGATAFAGSLTKQSSGTWALDQPMTYSGNTSITNGTLALTGSASIPNSPVISVASIATLNVSGLTNRFTLGQSQTLTGSGIILGNLNVAGTVNGDTTIHGDVALASTGAIKGNTTITGTLSGSGHVDPGNSPGLVTAVQIDPSGGMAFNFELTRQGAPNFASPSDIGNDVLCLTGDDPFTSALSSANAINLYVSAAAFNGGNTDIAGGFFTDFEIAAGLAADVDHSLLHIFIADPAGTTTYNGGAYSPLDLTQYNVDFTAVPQSAQFGANTVDGAITDLRITTVPEPLSAAAGALLLGVTASSRRPRRRRAAPHV